MKYRHRVLGFLCLLAAITYLDRVAISVAGPRIQESLRISPEAWGWFPILERARAMGTVLMFMQIGGAIAPLVIVPIQIHYGWRTSFYVMGMAGVVWSLAWYWWYRDTPAENANVTPAEIAEMSVD